MARKGRLDRGLMQKKDVNGKLVWYVRLYHQGKERRFGSFKTKTQARDFYDKAKQEQKNGRFFPERYQLGGYEKVSVRIADYLETRTLKKAFRDEQYFAKWWSAWFQGERVNAITPQRIEEAQQTLLRQGRAPGRINRYHGWLRHFLNDAVRKGKLRENPATNVTTLPEPEGRVRHLSLEEEAKLITALGPIYGPFARLAILTGLRQKEQFELAWKDVDLERGVLTLPATKAGTVQYVPLNQEARTLLRNVHSWQGSKWVFPSKNSATHINPSNFMKKYRRAVQQSGIDWVTWHDLRRTFGSRLGMMGKSDTTIATLLRHSTTRLVKRYTKLNVEYLQGTVEELSAFGKPQVSEEPKCLDTAENLSTPNGTVTKTVTGEKVEEGSRA
jgi:integrase